MEFLPNVLCFMVGFMIGDLIVIPLFKKLFGKKDEE